VLLAAVPVAAARLPEAKPMTTNQAMTPAPAALRLPLQCHRTLVHAMPEATVIEDSGGAFICNCHTPAQAAALVHCSNHYSVLQTALRDLLSLHNDQVFICGSDDEIRVEAALQQAASALKNITRTDLTKP